MINMECSGITNSWKDWKSHSQSWWWLKWTGTRLIVKCLQHLRSHKWQIIWIHIWLLRKVGFWSVTGSEESPVSSLFVPLRPLQWCKPSVWASWCLPCGTRVEFLIVPDTLAFIDETKSFQKPIHIFIHTELLILANINTKHLHLNFR